MEDCVGIAKWGFLPVVPLLELCLSIVFCLSTMQISSKRDMALVDFFVFLSLAEFVRGEWRYNLLNLACTSTSSEVLQYIWHHFE